MSRDRLPIGIEVLWIMVFPSRRGRPPAEPLGGENAGRFPRRGRRNGLSPVRRAELLPDAEALDQPVIALRVFRLQIVEQAPAAPDELQETRSEERRVG